MMAFSGVRSSWLMLARNALLARLDSSAACLAASVSSCAALAPAAISSHNSTTCRSSALWASSQIQSAGLDLPHHFVEAVHQHADLVIAALDRAQGVVPLRRKPGWPFPPGAEWVPRSPAAAWTTAAAPPARKRSKHAQYDSGIALQARIHVLQIPLQINGADPLSIEDHPLKQRQVMILKHGALPARTGAADRAAIRPARRPRRAVRLWCRCRRTPGSARLAEPPRSRRRTGGRRKPAPPCCSRATICARVVSCCVAALR